MEYISDYRIKEVKTSNRAHASNNTKTNEELNQIYLHNMALLSSLMIPAGLPVYYF
ncbi:MAG: hypothetical protein ACOX4N_10275 [Dethiobacteraceae bacterium]|jgi:hypothetical protein